MPFCFLAILFSLQCTTHSKGGFRVSENGDLIRDSSMLPFYHLGETIPASYVPVGRVHASQLGSPSDPCDIENLKEKMDRQARKLGADAIAGVFVSRTNKQGEKQDHGCWGTGMAVRRAGTDSVSSIRRIPGAIAIVSGELPPYEEWKKFLTDWRMAHPWLEQNFAQRSINGQPTDSSSAKPIIDSQEDYDTLVFSARSGDIFIRRRTWLQLDSKEYYSLPVDSGSPQVTIEQLISGQNLLPSMTEYQWADNILVCTLLSGAGQKEVGLIIKLQLFSRSQNKVIWETVARAGRKLEWQSVPYPFWWSVDAFLVSALIPYSEEWDDVIGDAVAYGLQSFPKPEVPAGR
jgi:hypothetical protein